MNWYAAHIVMAVQWKSKGQTRWPIWENIVLLHADSEETAFTKAEAHGRAEAGDDGGTFCWAGQPARWVFAGVRKITACADGVKRPGDGTEVTFNEIEVKSLEDLERFVDGEPVNVRYADQFESMNLTPPEKTESTQHRRRA